jgi:hypothetical protein
LEVDFEVLWVVTGDLEKEVDLFLGLLLFLDCNAQGTVGYRQEQLGSLEDQERQQQGSYSEHLFKLLRIIIGFLRGFIWYR